MKASKRYLENRLHVAVHVTAKAENGTYTITVHRVPIAGSDAIPAGKAAIYRMNDELRRCLRGTKLSVELRNRSGMSIVVSPGREKMKDGPILAIDPLPN